MALIELYCPRCGGEVRMDQSMMFGTCLNCGARCLLQEMVPKRTEVTVEGTPTVDGLVDLALRMWTIGDEDSAYRAVGDALRQSPEDVRAWILRGLMDEADVSSALGDSMLDPARDLDFCLTILNRRPDAIRWISGRMDHPLIRSIEALRRVSGYCLGSGQVILTVFDDELDTGYERIVREFMESVGGADKHIETIRKEPRLSQFASSFDKTTLGRLRSYSEWLDSHPPVDSQMVSVRYDGISLFTSFEHIHDGKMEPLRARGGRMDIRAEPGKHVFRCGSEGGFIAFIPRMPVTACEGTLVPGACVEVLHTFELTDGLFLNVNTRDGSLPATFDMSDNLVPTTGNAFQLGRFLRTDPESYKPL